MEIESHNDYRAEDFRALSRAAMPRFIPVLFLIASLFVVLFLVMTCIMLSRMGEEFFPGILAIVGGVALCFIFAFQLFLMPKFMERQWLRRGNMVLFYTFYADHMQIKVDNQETYCEKIPYSTLRRAVLLGDRLVLFIHRNTGYVVRKDGFSAGEYDMVCNHLKAALGLRFSVKSDK